MRGFGLLAIPRPSAHRSFGFINHLITSNDKNAHLSDRVNQGPPWFGNMFSPSPPSSHPLTVFFSVVGGINTNRQQKPTTQKLTIQGMSFKKRYGVTSASSSQLRGTRQRQASPIQRLTIIFPQGRSEPPPVSHSIVFLFPGHLGRQGPSPPPFYPRSDLTMASNSPPLDP